jgi:hypothetical protein
MGERGAKNQFLFFIPRICVLMKNHVEKVCIERCLDGAKATGGRRG